MLLLTTGVPPSVNDQPAKYMVVAGVVEVSSYVAAADTPLSAVGPALV